MFAMVESGRSLHCPRSLSRRLAAVRWTEPRFGDTFDDMFLSARLAHLAVAALLAAPCSAWAHSADRFEATILAVHNAERAQVGSPPLTWDPALAAGAAPWAQYLASTGQFVHSDRKSRPGIKENLWKGPRGVHDVGSMVHLWVSEKQYFVPGIFPANSRTGNWLDVSHYTQLIWPTTQRVGCALSSGRGSDFLVCRYSPAGNIDGRPVPAPPAPVTGTERGR